MAYVMMLPLKLHPPRFECKDDPAKHDSKRLETETEYYLAKRGLPLPLDRFPRLAKLISSHKTIDDILHARSMKWAISQRVRDIFETHAPGQIEFVPVNLVRKGGKLVNDCQYFYMNIQTGLRTIQWDKVTFEHKVHPNGWRGVDTLVLQGFWTSLGLQVDRTGHEDVKVWYEHDAGGISQWVFVSDDVMRALAAAGVTGPLADHVPEVARSEEQCRRTAPTTA